MFQQMLNGSIAVLTRPSVATFEEFEQDNLSWAIIYVLIGTAINVVISAVGGGVQGLFAPEVTAGEAGAAVGVGLVGGITIGLAFALLGFFIFLGIVYGLSRAFGGTGSFGELGFDVSLYWVPVSIVQALLSFISVGVLSILVLPISLALAGYNIYLTYLGIQSGMNLPRDKALYVVLILIAISLALVACIVLVFGAILATVINAAQ